jgi:localization factor PodJL
MNRLPPAEAEPSPTNVAAAPEAKPPLVVPTVEPAPPIVSADVARPEPDKAEPPRPGPGLDYTTLAIDDLRARGDSGDIAAMEEMARRLVQGIGAPRDQQAGAGWLLRAAQAGSPQSMFNVGVMYERGFVVERDSGKAIEWYRKAVAANLAAAKHNLALLLREGKGTARNLPEAIDLLKSAARQGMSASMFTLGDIHERGDTGTKDIPTALAWFAIAVEFDRQMSKGQETALMKSALQRAAVLQRSMTPREIADAQRMGQAEFRQIVDALSITKTPRLPASEPETAATTPPPAPPVETPGWPEDKTEQARVLQQALADLKLLQGKPDGVIGPMSRAAIREFQKGAGLAETGEPSREVYVALLLALSKRDAVANSPLPAPPKTEPPKVEAKPEEKPAPQINVGTPLAPPPPPTSADLAKQAEAERIKSIQALLRAMNFSKDAPDGKAGPATRNAIREYERAAGLKETGEPTQTLLDSLREMSGLLKR